MKSGEAIQGLHKNLHRLASLAICASVAPTNRASPTSNVASAYQAVLAKKVRVTTEKVDQVASYLRSRSLVRKYSHGGPSANEFWDRLASGQGTVEYQDWCLSDPRLPSRSGSEREQSYASTIGACQELGVLGESTNTLQAPGRLLLHLAGLNGITPSPSTNAFLHRLGYTIGAYYLILNCDYAFQRAVLDSTSDRPKSFYSGFAADSSEIIRNGTRLLVQTPANRSMFGWLRKRQEFADRLVKWKKNEQERRRAKKNEAEQATAIQPTEAEQTLYRPMEDFLLPRLEFLVDVGALQKDSPDDFVYRRAGRIGPLLDSLRVSREGAMGSYFKNMSELHDRRISWVSIADVIDHLYEPWKVMRNIGGYAPVADVVVMANCSRWDRDPWPVIEVPTAFEMLAELARRPEAKIRLVSDRYRRPEGFRIVDDVA